MRRLRILPELAVGACLMAAVLLQQPGRVIRDTKLQAALDPGGLFETGLHLWDPTAAFGHVPNQAAGYLFPLAPLFALGEAVGLPAWAVQRLWIGALLVAAYAGTVLLARELGVGSRVSRSVGGLAYALSPAALSILGHQSAATTGFALLPLALWPLVRGSVHGSPRRAAAASVLVVVAMGGANATSVVTVLVLPVLWLLTRPPGPRRRALLGWWTGGVALATLWWTGPLVLQGRYGLNFADVTETAGLTTGTTSLAEVLRGAGTWTSYLVVNGRTWVPAGWSIATDEVAIIGATIVVALGLFGLARRDLPDRLPFVLSLLAGAGVMAAGWVGPFDGPLADSVRTFLSGAGTPLRNIHKFAPLVGLPVALGVVHTLHLAAGWRPEGATRVVRHAAVATVALAAVVAGALPLVTGDIPLRGSFEEVPDDWQDAATWIDDHDDGTRTLLLPAASFGEYQWGRPFDEPLGSLTDGNWAVRNLVPLGAPGSTRLLDTVEDVLVAGRPSAGLATVLSRAGIGHVVVRNDLDAERATAPPPAVVRHVLEGSPGLERAASFGEPAPAELPSSRRVPGSEPLEPLAPVEIYEVSEPEPVAVAYAASAGMDVTGVPESLVTLAGAVRLDGRAVVAAQDAAADREVAPAQAILTDGSQRRDIAHGRVHDRGSYVLTADEDAPGSSRPAETTAPSDEPVTVAEYPEVEELRASSYAQGSRRLPETGPFAALDGDPVSSWRVSANRAAVDQWIEIGFDEPHPIDDLTVQLPAVRLGRARITAFTVTTDDGDTEVEVTGPGNRRRVELPDGETRRLRITIDAISGRPVLETAGIAEIELSSFTPERTLRVPRVDGATGAVLSRDRADAYDLVRHDEERIIDRTLELDDATLRVRGTATARPGPALLASLEAQLSDADLTASATSVWGNLPEYAAWWAADGDPDTAWLSDPANPSPALTLTSDGEHRLDGLRVTPGSASRPIGLVEVEAGGVERSLRLEGGVVRFPPTTTDEVTVRFPATEDLEAGSVVALAEVEVLGLDGATTGDLDRSAALDDTCGDELGVDVDGRPVPVRLTGTVQDLVALNPLRMVGCRPLDVEEGEHRLVATGSPTTAVDTVVLDPGGPARPAEQRPVDVLDWSTTSRQVRIGAGSDALLAVNEGFNRGWEARMDGETLEPVRLDGWRQGFVVPAGEEATIDLRFTPDRPYRLFLLVGLLGTLAAVAAALVRDRRTPPEPEPEPHRGHARSWLVPVAVTALLALVGGVLALVVIPLWLLPGRQRSLPAIAAASYAVIGISIAMSPGPGGAGFDAGPQILAVLVLGAVGLSLAGEPRRAATDPPVDRPEPGPPAPAG
jgi:arabinofuranan 3-O-arabinosyltransferase